MNRPPPPGPKPLTWVQEKATLSQRHAAQAEEAALAGRDLVGIAERHGDEADDRKDEDRGHEQHGGEPGEPSDGHGLAPGDPDRRRLCGSDGHQFSSPNSPLRKTMKQADAQGDDEQDQRHRRRRREVVVGERERVAELAGRILVRQRVGGHLVEQVRLEEELEPVRQVHQRGIADPRADDRQLDVPGHPPGVGAVDLGRLDDLVRDAVEPAVDDDDPGADALEEQHAGQDQRQVGSEAITSLIVVRSKAFRRAPIGDWAGLSR